MPLTGLDAVVGNFKTFIDQVKGEKTENAITAMLTEGAQVAAGMTPVDTNNLLNGQYKKLWETPKGYSGAVYYIAPYAKWVHEMSGKLKGQPRAHFGVTSNVYKRGGPQKIKQFGGGSLTGNYWDPAAEPQFLKKGMEEMAENAPNILAEAYKV